MNTKIELIWLADKLDRAGMTTEANVIDEVIRKNAEEEADDSNSTKIFPDEPEPSGGFSTEPIPEPEPTPEPEPEPEPTPEPEPEPIPEPEPGVSGGAKEQVYKHLDDARRVVEELVIQIVENEDSNLEPHMREALANHVGNIEISLNAAVARFDDFARECKEAASPAPGGGAWEPVDPGGPEEPGSPVNPGGPDDDDDDDDDDFGGYGGGRSGMNIVQEVSNVGNTSGEITVNASAGYITRLDQLLED